MCICAALYIWGINLVRGAEGSHGQGLPAGLKERKAMAAATAKSCSATPVPSNSVISLSEVLPGWVLAMT